MSKPKYDSTIARIAGNILSGMELEAIRYHQLTEQNCQAVELAVLLARAVVAEVIRTTPVEEPTA